MKSGWWPSGWRSKTVGVAVCCLAGCGNEADSALDCREDLERCECPADGDCGPGLECWSGICVDPHSADVTDSSAATTSTGTGSQQSTGSTGGVSEETSHTTHDVGGSTDTTPQETGTSDEGGSTDSTSTSDDSSSETTSTNDDATSSTTTDDSGDTEATSESETDTTGSTDESDTDDSADDSDTDTDGDSGDDGLSGDPWYYAQAPGHSDLTFDGESVWLIASTGVFRETEFQGWWRYPYSYDAVGYPHDVWGGRPRRRVVGQR